MAKSNKHRKRGKIRREPVIATFGLHLKQLRLERGLSQQELATRAGAHVTYISRLERGEAAPGLDLLDQLARALEVPLAELLPSQPADSLSLMQAQARRRLESILQRADTATLGLLNPWLALLDDALHRRRPSR